MTVSNLPEAMRLIHSEREGTITVWEGVGGMRMFDTSAPPTDGPPRQDLCPHVWSNIPMPMTISIGASGTDALAQDAKAFPCTLCGAFLVLYDRAG